MFNLKKETIMKATTSTAVSLALLVLATVPAHAAEMKDMPGMKMAAEKATESTVHKGQGTVNRVDEKSGKVNLAHGPISTLKWPGMTMDFQVRDKALLKGVTPGQNVEFDVVQASPGQFVITRIAPAARKNVGK